MRTWKCWALGVVVLSFLMPAARAERYRQASAMIHASSAAPSGTYDAFINVAWGPYPDASSITTGNASPWYDSAAVVPLFGGTPTPQQRNSFDQAVFQPIQRVDAGAAERAPGVGAIAKRADEIAAEALRELDRDFLGPGELLGATDQVRDRGVEIHRQARGA